MDNEAFYEFAKRTVVFGCFGTMLGLVAAGFFRVVADIIGWTESEIIPRIKDFFSR